MQRLSLLNDGLTTCAESASKVLAAGGLVVGPTDTLYGIFAAWDDREAVERLYTLKGRDEKKRLLALVSDYRMAERISAIPLPPALRHYWPGPLTLILPTKTHPFAWETQAVRLPADDFSSALARCLGKPVYAPSANLQGQRPALTCQEAEENFGERIDLYIDAGCPLGGLPSTILSLVGKAPLLIREGQVTVALEDFACFRRSSWA